MIDHGVLDSEALNLMRTALDHAWEALPPNQQSAQTRERLAQAVVALATQWERDPERLGGQPRRAREPVPRRRLSPGAALLSITPSPSPGSIIGIARG